MPGILSGHAPPVPPRLACPACEAGEGRVREVATTLNHRTVKYVCTTCQHQWRVTEPVSQSK